MVRVFLLILFISSISFAQRIETFKLGSSQYWFHLKDGLVTDENEEPMKGENNWEVSFQSGQQGGIWINEAAGVLLWNISNKFIDNFGESIDTNGLADGSGPFEAAHNSVETWNVGAFNLELDGFGNGAGDFGWGQYNPTTHTVMGSKLFIIRLLNGEYKQFIIELSAGQVNYIKFANLDGSEENILEFDRKNYSLKNFGYYSISDGAELDREPNKTDWHLTFGSYAAPLQAGPEILHYPVTGVRTNGSVVVAQVNDAEDIDDPKKPSKDSFTHDITTIGHDWKYYDFQKSQYFMSLDTLYFVFENQAKLDESETSSVPFYALRFLDYTGGLDKEVTFEVYEFNVNSIEDEKGNIGQFSVFPNIISRGETFNVVSNIQTNKNLRFNLINSQGNIIKSFAARDNFTATPLESNNLAAGIYFINVTGEGVNQVQQLIVK